MSFPSSPLPYANPPSCAIHLHSILFTKIPLFLLQPAPTPSPAALAFCCRGSKPEKTERKEKKWNTVVFFLGQGGRFVNFLERKTWCE